MPASPVAGPEGEATLAQLGELLDLAESLRGDAQVRRALAVAEKVQPLEGAFDELPGAADAALERLRHEELAATVFRGLEGLDRERERLHAQRRAVAEVRRSS